MTLKIGITGHRTLANALLKEKELIDAITKILKKNKAHSFEAYSAIATGADTLFAKVALEKFNANLHLILPFAKEEYAKDFEGEDLITFNDLCKKAIIIDEVTNGNDIKDEERNNGYYKGGVALVDHCDVIIAMWDGNKAEGTGGTGDIVDYARKTNKALVIIKTLRTEREEMQDRLDHEAMASKKEFEGLWQNAILMGLSAALVLALKLSFPWKSITCQYELIKVVLASIELILIIIFFGLIIYISRSKIKDDVISKRRVTERLRVINTFLNAGIRLTPLESKNGIPDDFKIVEDEFIKSSMNSTFDINKAKDKLNKLVEEQIKYHWDKRPNKEGVALEKLESPLIPLKFILFFSVLLHTVIEWLEYTEMVDHELLIWPGSITLFASLAVPPIYAALEGFKYFYEYERKLSDSKQMVNYFTKKQKLLASETDPDNIQDIANSIRIKMDEENVNWTLLVETKKTPG